MYDTPLIACAYTSLDTLHAAYMPFVKKGGLFVRTDKEYPLGTKVLLSALLLDDLEPRIIDGTVVWITPKGACDNKPQGMGIQFTGEHASSLRNTIETFLKEMLESYRPTDTV